MLPITAKLNPFALRRNFFYLTEATVLTRLTIGAVRVWQNKPSRLHDPELNLNQKRLAFWERFFVEILGTSGTITILHLGQDLISKVMEAGEKARIPVLKDIPGLAGDPGERAAQLKKANEAIRLIYGPDSRGLISRVMYGKRETINGVQVIRKASLVELRKALGPEFFEQVRPCLRDFVVRMNRRAAVSVVGGVMLSAAFGGFFIQWTNDYLVSPFIQKILHKKYPRDGAVDHKNAPTADVTHPHAPRPLPTQADSPTSPSIFASQPSRDENMASFRKNVDAYSPSIFAVQPDRYPARELPRSSSLAAFGRQSYLVGRSL